MLARWLADAVLLLHLAFILFVVLGGLLALRRPQFAWLHLPAALWGVLIEFTGGICPLTPLENALRRRGGDAGYPGGFIEHYLVPLIYPGSLTRPVQVALGAAVVLINLAIYWQVARRARRRRAP